MHLSDSGELFSYYVAELGNGAPSRSECDLIVGYLAKENTTFTFNFGPIHESREISAGTFEYAYGGEVVPLVSAPYSDYSISDMSGSAYVIYANLDRSLKTSMVFHTINNEMLFLGGHTHIIGKQQVHSIAELRERARQEQENTFCNRVLRFFGGTPSVPSRYAQVEIKAE